MADSDKTDLNVLNDAAQAIGAELFAAGLDRVNEYASQYGIQEADIPLVLANAYLRVAALTNASAFGLNADDLAGRFNKAIQLAAREL